MIFQGARCNTTASRINGIPCKVYKKCPQLSRFWFNIFKFCVKHCAVPIQWQYAMEHYICKTDQPSPSKIEDFRPIMGKLFFSLISKRLKMQIIANNKFINKSVQKGCMEKVPGCWKHMSMVWGSLKEARCNKFNVADIWLVIGNVYGSIPHILIFFALERYYVHKHWISLMKAYYFGILRVYMQAALYPSSFSQLEPMSS